MNIKVFFNRLLIAISHLKDGSFNNIWEGITVRFFSNHHSYGLKRDFTTPFNIIGQKKNLKIRLFNHETDLFALDEGQRHLRLVKENIPTCYVAVDELEQVCYRQWVFKASENDRLKKYFGNLFPELNSNEGLIEGVFTKPDYRGLNIMSNAIDLILKENYNQGTNLFLVFVNKHNIASLKGFHKSGFTPYVYRIERWRFFKRYVTFHELNIKNLKSFKNRIK